MDPVLIVDDDPSFLSIVTAFMGKAGWRFEIAVSGQQAIARLATNSFAAVILDLNLPDISGLDVLRAIARPPNAPPVLFISGDASVQSALEAGRFGAVEFLEKPITMSDLLTKLEACTQQRAAQEFQPVVVAPRFSRLAEIVVRASKSPYDFRTGRGLAKAGSVGYGTLRRWCRDAGVPGRSFVRFARGVWAVRRGFERKCPPADLLEFVDPQSVATVLGQLPMGTTTAEYCASQKHLSPTHPLVLFCLMRCSGHLGG